MSSACGQLSIWPMAWPTSHSLLSLHFRLSRRTVMPTTWPASLLRIAFPNGAPEFAQRKLRPITMYVEPTNCDDPSGSASEPAILCVDDDMNLLDGLRRQLRKKFRVHIALGGLQALDVIATNGPFGVVVSDLQMPGMDGIEFLSRVRSISPHTMRIMLTGRADISTAMAAVNQGNIFRFLVKPCTPVVIEKVLEAALDQYKLIVAERQLTHETLLGCVQSLVEVLGIVQPEAFQRGIRVRRRVQEISAAMKVPTNWELESAAILSQVGWITLHPAISSKATTDQPMSDDERKSFQGHAAAGARILEKIPNMGVVAKMIELQHCTALDLLLLSTPGLRESVRVLKAAIASDSLHRRGLREAEILEEMQRESDIYPPEVLAAVGRAEIEELDAETRLILVANLAAGMTLNEDLRNDQGLIVLGQGQRVTPVLVERLRSFAYGVNREKMIKIRS